MQPDDIKRIDAWLVGKKLPPDLASEMNYYQNEVEWESAGDVPSPAEALCEWMDRHEADKSAGWLDRRSYRFCRQAMVETGIAKPVKAVNAYYVESLINGVPGNRVWFRYQGKAYEYHPEDLNL